MLGSQWAVGYFLDLDGMTLAAGSEESLLFIVLQRTASIYVLYRFSIEPGGMKLKSINYNCISHQEA